MNDFYPYNIILFFILFSVLVPWAINKFKIKDDIKFKETLPVGTAQFRGFLRVVGLVIIFTLVLGVILNILDSFLN